MCLGQYTNTAQNRKQKAVHVRNAFTYNGFKCTYIDCTGALINPQNVQHPSHHFYLPTLGLVNMYVKDQIREQTETSATNTHRSSTLK